MGYSLSEDCRAGRAAFAAAWEAALEGRLLSLDGLCSRLRGRRVCVAGSAASLRGEARLLEACDAAVAADGAAAYLLGEGWVPDIVVTDGDGPLQAIEEAASLGSVTVLYFHGDNYRLASWLARRLRPLVVSTQCVPPLYLHGAMGVEVLPATGFTDGDRAAWLAACCGASRLLLLGMDTRGPSLAGTKPWLRRDAEPGSSKRAKLSIAERLLAPLMLLGAELP